MANFTVDQIAACDELMSACEELNIPDPTPVKDKVYRYILGYKHARSGLPQDGEYATPGRYCPSFCNAYIAGYTSGTT